MFNLRITSAVAVAMIATTTVASQAADTSDPSFRFLAADPSLRAGMSNVSTVMGQATHVGEVLRLDQEWELTGPTSGPAGTHDGWKLMYAGSVVRDPATGQFKMYYEMLMNGSETLRALAYAVSDDGVNWTKPALNLTGQRYSKNPANNFVNVPTTGTWGPWYGGGSVFIDPNNGQYRMTATVQQKQYLYTSTDGINFSAKVGEAHSTYFNGAQLDTQNDVFWDPKTQKYVAALRMWYPASPLWRRGVFTRSSDTYEGIWDPAYVENINPAIILGATGPQIYNPGIVPYHGQYVGLPSMQYNEGTTNMDGSVYPSFMYSRDNLTWVFPDAEHSMIDLSAHGQTAANFGQAYRGGGLVNKDGTLYIYYTYFPEHHGEPRSSGVMHLATMKEDRFEGIHGAADAGGSWTTSLIELTDIPGQLKINAEVNGSIFVEVLDAITMLPLDGFSAADALAIGPGDYLSAGVSWSDAALQDLAGQTVALRFLLDDATIYSYRFENAAVPEPGIAMLVGLGMVGMCLRPRRRASMN